MIYPNQQRRHVTTNEELFHNNQGNFKSHSTAINIFDNSFKIDQNYYNKSNINTNTVYKNDFLRDASKERDPVITRTKFEAAKMYKYGKKIPMDTTTQNMRDFLEFDSQLYKNILNSKSSLHPDMFRSSIRGNLINNNMTTPASTYGGDFNQSGVDLCMSKAYRRLENSFVWAASEYVQCIDWNK